MEISHDQYVETFNKLPAPIRSYLIDDELGNIVQTLAQKYTLHVDVTGMLARSTSYMLMGLMSPTQLQTELVQAGVSSETATSLLTELNEKIFVPVRGQVQASQEQNGEVIIDSAPAEALTKVSPSAPSIPPAVVRPETKPVALNTPPIPVTSVVPAPATPAPTQSQASTPVPVHLPMRTMAADMEAVKEHRPIAPITSSMPVVAPTASTPQPLVTSVQPPPPSNLPGVPLVKEYSADPYRETF